MCYIAKIFLAEKFIFEAIDHFGMCGEVFFRVSFCRCDSYIAATILARGDHFGRISY
jgi:hypothetical protein